MSIKVLLLLTLTPAVHAETIAVRGFVLPTRRDDAAQLQAKLREVVQRWTRSIPHAQLGSEPPPLDLSRSLEHAEKLFRSAALDQAAGAFDALLEDGAHTPHRLSDPAAFVTAHLTRAFIAFGRGEARRADELVTRAFRYDPTLELLASERSPRMRAALDGLRRNAASRRALLPSDVGDSCRTEVVLVGRMISKDSFELTRFDACREIAKIETPLSDSTEKMARLLIAAASPPTLPARAHQRRWWPILISVGGLAVAGAGAALVAVGLNQFQKIADECNGMCPPEKQNDPGVVSAEQSALAGYVLLGVGGAAIVGGVTGYLINRRSPSAQKKAWLEPTLGGLRLSGRF